MNESPIPHLKTSEAFFWRRFRSWCCQVGSRSPVPHHRRLLATVSVNGASTKLAKCGSGISGGWLLCWVPGLLFLLFSLWTYGWIELLECQWTIELMLSDGNTCGGTAFTLRMLGNTVIHHDLLVQFTIDLTSLTVQLCACYCILVFGDPGPRGHLLHMSL